MTTKSKAAMTRKIEGYVARFEDATITVRTQDFRGQLLDLRTFSSAADAADELLTRDTSDCDIYVEIRGSHSQGTGIRTLRYRCTRYKASEKQGLSIY